MSDESFLSRWSRRKAQQRDGVEAPAQEPLAPPRASQPLPEVVNDALPVEAQSATPIAAPEGPASPEPQLPTMEDVAALTRESDYSRFVAPGVDQSVQRAAMKKLFSDPHFNVMDGLDTYIEDYNRPDPIPPAMLRRLNQSKLLRLFDDEEERGVERDDNPPSEPMQTAAQEAAVPSAAPQPSADDDHDADLQLQPDDDAGRSGPEPSPRA